jgi:putative acetyltransferase
LPGDYAPPRGCLLLARLDKETAGCVGVRPVDATTCEIKRLFVRAPFRRKGLGRVLADDVISRARNAGYERACLETLPAMKVARALYVALGFRRCAPYDDNSCVGSDCLALGLLPDRNRR